LPKSMITFVTFEQ